MGESFAFVGGIIGMSLIAAAFYGNRFRKRRLADHRRRRGYKEYNRDRPKLILDRSAETAAEKPAGSLIGR